MKNALTVKVDEEILKKFRVKCVQDGISYSEKIKDLIEAWI